MRPLPFSHHSNPAARTARLAFAAGALAGLTVLGACADNAGNTITAPQSPRNSTIFGTGFVNEGTVKVCVDASSPAGTYKFTNSGFLSRYALDGVTLDEADGGNGTTIENVPDGIEYTIAVGSCQTVLTRTVADTWHEELNFHDTWSGINVTATTIPETAFYTKTDCYLDAGPVAEELQRPAIPNPCDTGNNPTRAYAQIHHGTVLTFFFGRRAVPPNTPTPLFVIGDVETHGIGANVNFWGGQWWKKNLMSGLVSSGVGSFKGYTSSADNFCGGTWSSRVGDSAPPSNQIPEDVVIIVTSKVVKSGPNIGGDIEEILIVHQDGGYGPNPGHDGNGSVTTIVCGPEV